MLSGCLRCEGERPPEADGEGTSAQVCRELGDWLHTGEELKPQLEAPCIPV